MIRNGTTSASKYGSIRLLDGTYYATNWTPVLTPLDAGEAQQFIQAVETLEHQRRRALTKLEVDDVASLICGG